MKILREETYQAQMEQVVEPYLAARVCEQMLEREPERGIHCMLYRANLAKGCVVISHGFTESEQKYHEVVYGFLRQGYHVILPEHCGHGRSYRLVQERSLVHVDSWQRYVDDLLFVTNWAVRELSRDFTRESWGTLPVYLYAHSMGGGIGAAAAAQAPELFQKVVLSSPMIRPTTGNVPWRLTKLLTQLACMTGKAETYGPGQKPYVGRESFSESSSLSQARFQYYQDKKQADPDIQTCACSWGWLREALALNRYLQRKAWKTLTMPIRLYQAGDELLVSKTEQERFIRKISHRTGNWDAKLIPVESSRHEIFNAQMEVQNIYWKKIYHFLRET